MTNSNAKNALNVTTLAQVQISQISEHLKQDHNLLLQAYNDYAGDIGCESIYENDDDNIDMIFPSASDAIRSAFFGDYNHSHAYFVFNGYGNLQSFRYLDDENSPIDMEELAQWVIDNDRAIDYNIEVTTLDDMLASIEDNINDCDLLALANVMDNLGLEIKEVDNIIEDGYEDLEEYCIETILNEVSDYEYNQLNNVINLLGIDC